MTCETQRVSYCRVLAGDEGCPWRAGVHCFLQKNRQEVKPLYVKNNLQYSELCCVCLTLREAWETACSDPGAGKTKWVFHTSDSSYLLSTGPQTFNTWGLCMLQYKLFFRLGHRSPVVTMVLIPTRTWRWLCLDFALHQENWRNRADLKRDHIVILSVSKR